MRDELLEYYEKERDFLAKLIEEFAQDNKDAAARLLLQGGRSEDPHVALIINAFARLTGRIHLKLDDEFPEITESLLNVLYPHYLLPVPSMSIAQFPLEAVQGRPTVGHHVAPRTMLVSAEAEGRTCSFQTAYPVTVWPVELVSASLGGKDDAPPDAQGRWHEATLRLSLRCVNGTKLSTLWTSEKQLSPRPFERLRFYLNGGAALVHALYEMIFNNVAEVGGVELRAGGSENAPRVRLERDAIKPVGFEPGEELLPHTARSFRGYRLLTEYFAFPEKFLFFDLTGLDRAARAEGFEDKLDVLIHLRDVRRPDGVVDAKAFQLGCTPVVNLFSNSANSFVLRERKTEYEIIPDVYARDTTEVYSVDSVMGFDKERGFEQRFHPFYSFRHGGGESAFWYASRRTSVRKPPGGGAPTGTDVFLTLVDRNFNASAPEGVKTLVIHTTCTNRDLPLQLPFGDSSGDFSVEEGREITRARCLKKPTAPLRPPLRRGAHWRLISHLSLNHLSITGGDGNASGEALRQILLLYDFRNSPAMQRQLADISSVESKRVARATGARDGGPVFVRGIETTVEFGQRRHDGGGFYLFTAVLERFLGLYASVNSFNQLVVKLKGREEAFKIWPPRAGEQRLL
ncbi:MAG TPA: type VI secretion system baseplate subunit TssF [Pyrinomonadaceae bacterium]|jgi:type VI secretion system protein ImpG